jgi:hypothetical protein
MIEGKQLSKKHIAEAFSAFIGGIIAGFLSIKILLLATGACAFSALILSFWIKEPNRSSYSHPRGTLYGFYKICRFIFLRSKIVRYVIPLMAACSVSTMLAVWLHQPLWEQKEVPVWMFGLLWALISLPAILTCHFADKLEKMIGKKLIIWLFPLPVLIGYFISALAPGYFAIIGNYFAPILRGLNIPILSKYIHEETYSDKRATVLSVQSWLFRVLFIIIGPFIGWTAKTYSISAAFITSGIIATLLMIIFIPPVVKRI